jgi:Fic family protein
MLNQLTEKIAQLKSEWESLQPLESERSARLWQKLRLEWNYNSNHIEGNTLTYGETQILLVSGRTVGQHKIREYEEMKAHDLAIAHVRELAADPTPITEADVRNLNKILLKEPFWKEAITADGQPTRKQVIPGQYKSSPNNVQTSTGEMFFFKSPEETPSLMSELIEKFRSDFDKDATDLPRRLAKFHHDFSVIHPFDDGNGRTMRLLVNYALLRNGYLPIVIKSIEKEQYLSALSQADAGDLNAFEHFLAENILWALNVGVRAAKGESIVEPEDWEKELSLFVQEHIVDDTPAPPRKWDMLKERMQDSWFTLRDAIKQKLSAFEKIFATVNVSLVGSSKPDDKYKLNNSHLIELVNLRVMPDTKAARQIIEFGWIIRLKGYSGKGAPPFDIDAEITAFFDQYRYKITGDGLGIGVENLRYDKKIDEDNFNLIVSSVVKFVLERVREKIRPPH